MGTEVAIGTWIVSYIVNENLMTCDPMLLVNSIEPLQMKKAIGVAVNEGLLVKDNLSAILFSQQDNLVALKDAIKQIDPAILIKAIDHEKIDTVLNTELVKGARESMSSGLLPWYWGGAMVGRLLGTFITQKIKGDKALAAVAMMSTLLIIFSTLGFALDNTMSLPVYFAKDLSFATVTIPVSIFSLLLVGLMNSIMWPSIFPLGVKGLGKFTAKGSGLMVTMVVGGAIVQLILKIIADGAGTFRYAFLICALCYIYIYFYATKLHKKKNPEADALLNE